MSKLQRIALAIPVIILSMTASPASSAENRPLCPKIIGTTVSVSGVIDSASVVDGAARYDLASEDSPCMSLYFSVKDPTGRLRCREGQRITASGLVVDNGLGADIFTTNYSCK